MQNNYRDSESIRRLIKNSIGESGLPAAELATEVAPWIRPTTCYRLLNSNQHIEPSVAEVLLHLTGSLAHQNAKHLWHVLNPSSSEAKPSHVRELLSAICVPAEEFSGHFDAAASSSRALLGLYKILPPSLLDEDVNHKVVANLAKRFASDPKKIVPQLRQEAEQLREAFMTEGRLGTVETMTVIMRLSDLLRMGLRLPPFGDCSMDEIVAALESLIHDAVEERGVRLAFVNDIAAGPARWRTWPWSDWGAVTLLDCGVLLKRHRNTLTHRLLRSQNSPDAAMLFESHRRELLELLSYSCHGLTAPQVIQFLQEFIAAISQQPVRRFWLSEKTR